MQNFNDNEFFYFLNNKLNFNTYNNNNNNNIDVRKSNIS
jgi:hypothetical protein